jgi:ATP-dependent Clp protease ATP-binding subunit ClpA
MAGISFIQWHYYTAFKEVLLAWGNFTVFAFHLFSVKFLLKTLLAPWRRVISQSNRETLTNRLVFNLISRFMGFLVRLFLIGLGLVLALGFFLVGLVFTSFWLFLPCFTWPLYLLTREKSQTREQLIAGEAKNFIWQRLNVQSEKDLAEIRQQDIDAVLDWYLENKKQMDEEKKFWRKENLFKLRSFGTDLAFGYTVELDQFSQDLAFPPPFAQQLVGRDKEVKEIEMILSRSNQANILLVGEPGVGKHTILLGLAKAIGEKRVNPKLFYKRVLMLNMNLILGNNPSETQGKAKFEQLLKEAEQAGNIILTIDQIDNYMSEQGGTDLTSALAAVAENQHIQIIGMTTPDEYNKKIFQNEEFLKYFEKVEVQPLTAKEALKILQQVLPKFEKGKKVVTTYWALKEIVDQSDKLITHIPFPEKAIDLLDQLIAQAENEGKNLVGKKEVQLLISQKTNVPVGSLSINDTDKLSRLDQLLHQRIVNQNQAVTALTQAMQRAKTGVSEAQKPMGTFLFLGPTGVGKTETAKALAAIFFNDEKRMVRFDMSQSCNLDILVNECREHPYSVLLLDEFEKSDQQTHHLFLTVFDEGYLKDKEGKKVSFKNMIIICTSNAAAEFIRQQVKTGLKAAAVVEHVLQKGIFSPELVNRFDGVVVFEPLKLEHVVSISRLMLTKLVDRLKEKEINLRIDSSVYRQVALQGYHPEFGARPLKRLIADKIETQMARLLLDNQIAKGDTIKLLVDPVNKGFKIEKLK